ncbi:hypothetical protein A2U01_0001472, partial [Trifolium medium]|nr:hypothetical protein [Trifolium medium]
MEDDSWRWVPNPDGVFSVKSSYDLLVLAMDLRWIGVVIVIPPSLFSLFEVLRGMARNKKIDFRLPLVCFMSGIGTREIVSCANPPGLLCDSCTVLCSLIFWFFCLGTAVLLA